MKLLIATILLLTAFMATADSDYLPKSNAALTYAPTLDNGFLSLAIDNSQNSVLVYAPSIIWVEGYNSGGEPVAILHMIEGITIKTVVKLSDLNDLLNAKSAKPSE